MAEVTISIKGRQYDIACDDGQEGRVVDLAAYIDSKLQMISRSGSAYNDAHLMVLTSLVLADELFEAREGVTNVKPVDSKKIKEVVSSVSKEDEQFIAKKLQNMTKRIESLVSNLESVA